MLASPSRRRRRDPPSPAAAPAASAPRRPAQPIVRRALALGRRRAGAICPAGTSDRSAELWPALAAQLRAAGAGLARRLCERARAGDAGRRRRARAWLQQQLQPYRVESLDGAGDGLITGYFEPLVEASRVPRARLSRRRSTRRRADLATRKPVLDAPADSTRCRRRSTRLQGREIAWVADPLDALVLQVQGSGRLRITEPDGSRTAGARRLRGAQRPAVPIGRPLAGRAGRAALEQASWPAIRAWARAEPAARQRDAVQQPARRVLPRGAAARSGRSARRARRACR